LDQVGGFKNQIDTNQAIGKKKVQNYVYLMTDIFDLIWSPFDL